MEEHLVVFLDWEVFIPLHLQAHLDDPSGDGGNFRLVRQHDPAAGGGAALVFADQNPHPQRLHKLIVVHTSAPWCALVRPQS